MILCIGTTPAAQRVMVFRQLTLDAVNRAVTTVDGAAGKSVNVAKVLKALGEHPVATGFLGGDRGEEVRTLMEAQGIELDFVPVASRTRQCITVFDRSAGTHTELVEEGRPVPAADYEKLMGVIQRRVKGCRAVVMSGTITRRRTGRSVSAWDTTGPRGWGHVGRGCPGSGARSRRSGPGRGW